jgi:hypothetical protein
MSVATEQAFVASAYSNILFRSPANIASAATQADIDTQAALISGGQITETQFATNLAAGAEVASNVLPIVALYEGLLKRAPEAGALAFYVADLTAGDTVSNITQDFLSSAEFKALYGAQPTTTALVSALYQNVLGRTASQAETAYYVGILGGASAVPSLALMAEVVQYFIHSPEAVSDSSANVQAWLVAGVNGTYPATIATTPPVSASAATYVLTNGGATSATEGSVVTFHIATTNVAAGSTLAYTLTGVTASEIVGGLLTGTVTLAANGTAAIPVALNATAGEGLSGSLAATITIPGAAASGSVTTASVPLTETPAAAGPILSIPGTGGVAITATATTAYTGGVIVGNSAGLSEPTGAITITDNAASGPVLIYGGSGVTVTTFSSGGVMIGAGSLATDPTGAVTVTDNATSGAVQVYGGAGVTVSTASVSGVSVGTPGGTAEPSGAVTITDTAANGIINVFGGAAVVITSASAAAINVGIAGLAAADPTGNITITNHNGASGFGTATATVFTNGGNTATITGTSGDSITDASATALLANVTLDGVGGATRIHTNNLLLSLTVLDGASGSTDTISGAAGHTLALTVGSTNSIAAFANVTDATAHTINVSATGSTVETLILAAPVASSITLGAHTGTDSLVLGTVAAAASAPSVIVSGAVAGDSVRFADTATSVVSAGAVTGTLAAAIASVDALASTIAHSATLFQNGGLTYVLESVAAGTGVLHAGDSLIELVGTHTLSSPVSGLLTLLT